MAGAADFLTEQWDRLAHPVYNQLGRQIGFFTTDRALAAGTIQLFAGEVAGPPMQWQVKNALGIPVAADAYLISHGLQPSWLQRDGPITQAIAAEQSGSPGDFSLPGLSLDLPDLSLPQLPQLSAQTTGTILLWGALGLAAVFVIARRA